MSPCLQGLTHTYMGNFPLTRVLSKRHGVSKIGSHSLMTKEKMYCEGKNGCPHVFRVSHTYIWAIFD